MKIFIVLLTGIGTFVLMEGVAWLAHKYLMHGLLWYLHRDHHQPQFKKEGSFFEKNDWFFVIFALPSMVFYIWGSLAQSAVLFAIAIGITGYGFAYFIFHEVVFHRRLNWFRKWKSPYIRALKKAHSAHHRHLNHKNGECFGLLVFPYRFLQSEIKKP